MNKIIHLLFLSTLLFLVFTPGVLAEEQITNITYISYAPNEALEKASETNDHSDLINYTFINYYNATSKGISDELLQAAETGFLETQDVIVCDYIGSTILADPVINETLISAHNKGTELYTLRTMGHLLITLIIFPMAIQMIPSATISTT